ncbi:MAG: hypothetical protein ACRCTW_09850 [Lactococcus garvieae]
MNNIKFKRNTPDRVKKMAYQAIEKLTAGLIHYRKMEHGKFKILEVGYRYRIVIRGSIAMCLSHEDYNKLHGRFF